MVVVFKYLRYMRILLRTFLKHALHQSIEQNTTTCVHDFHPRSDKSFKNEAESSNLIAILASFRVLDIFPEFANIATCYSGHQLS